jgi:hypothetical protein
MNGGRVLQDHGARQSMACNLDQSSTPGNGASGSPISAVAASQ